MVDPSGWDHHRPEPPSHLEVLQRAVIDGVQVRLSYRSRNGTETDRTVHPLGLVVKRTVWYLVAHAEAGLRTFRVGRVRSVVVTDEPVHRAPRASIWRRPGAPPWPPWTSTGSRPGPPSGPTRPWSGPCGPSSAPP